MQNGHLRSEDVLYICVVNMKEYFLHNEMMFLRYEMTELQYEITELHND